MKSMRALKVVTIFISPILLGYAFPIINSGDGDEDRSKIIIFSHKFHIEEVGADCSDCHLNVQGSSSSDTNLLPKWNNVIHAMWKRIRNVRYAT